MSKEEYKIGQHKRQHASGGMGIPGQMGMSVGIKANMKKSFGQLLGYCGKQSYFIYTAVLLSIGGTILNLIGPGKLSKITDMITDGLMTTIDISGIVKIAALLAILYLLGFILNYAQGYIMATVIQKVTQNMRRDISRKINKLPLKYFDRNSLGDVLSRVTNDVDTFAQTMNQSMSTIVSSLTMLFGSMIIMFSTNWIMALAGIISSVFGFFFMIIIIGKSQKYFSGQQSELGKIDGHVEELFAGHSVVKAYNGEKGAREEFHGMNENLYNYDWKAQFISGLMMPMMIYIGNFAYVIICILGAVLVMQDSISFGVIVAFMLYIRLFTQPLQNISQAATRVQSMAAACERIFEFINEEEMKVEKDNKSSLIIARGDVEFQNVQFGYQSNHTIIRDFSARIKAGQKVAIVGPTGAGKTTLVNLLMKFYEINKGKIRIDGVAINQMTRENVHDLFGMVLQDTWIFEGTIRDNISYNKSHISDEQLDYICEATGIADFINQQPNGYDTILNDKVNLSAGQKQLITIARAMAEEAPLLILDEATSSVDTRTEIKIQEAMDKLTKDRTSFIIAHRLSTIKNADIILVMKDGDIIENGTHKELLNKGGFYAELYNSQFEVA